jgi:uncharacterized membrane protein YkoI
MRIGTRISFYAVLIAVGLLLFGPTTHARAEQCLSPEETRQAIAEGRAQHLAAIKPVARKAARGDIVRSKLCSSKQGLVYNLTVLSRQGTVKLVKIHAQKGTILFVGGY